ncbi:MAG: hypothetical protein ACFFDW_01200 [Candidatus Thorarchaeota archaeon]
MSEMETDFNKTQTKSNFITKTPKFALISFCLGFLMIIGTIVSTIWFANYGSKTNEIYYTVILSILVISGILGSVFAGITFRTRVTVIGILALIFGIFL